MNRRIAVLLISLAMLFSMVVIIVKLPSPVSAVTIYVDDDYAVEDPTHKKTIQAGVDNASVGDTVYVYPGTYYENVIVDKTIDLVGENRENTTINGSGTDDVLSVTANQVTISGFTIEGGGSNIRDAGIELNSVQDCNISNNYVLSNKYWGIYLKSSSNNYISSNNISLNQNDGIEIEMSSNNNIIDNIFFSNNRHDIILHTSFNTNIIMNRFNNGGILIWGAQVSNYNSHNIPSNNLVNGKPIYYLKNISGLNIDGILVGQIILANCTDIHVRKLQINNTNVGIQIAYSSQINVTDNNICYNYIGIHTWLSLINIFDNNISSNDREGIHLSYFTNNSIIEGNNISDNEVGIYFSTSSNNNIITGNHISNNDYGIRLYGLLKNNTIINNNISNNGLGIYLFSKVNNNTIINNNVLNNGLGMYLHSTNYNEIIGNKILNNNDGIFVKESSRNNITINKVSTNMNYGIYLYSSSNNITMFGNNISNNRCGINISQSSFNKIYHNNFINNTIQAYDDSNNSNQWDNEYPSGGNYWSDHIGIDIFRGPNQDIPGRDGISDANYSIDIDSVDRYPLTEFFENCTILKSGWNLISIPLIQGNQSLAKVLEMIDGYYNAVQWYNPTDTFDPWKHHKVGKPFGNDLFELNETMGFWIHITQPGDTIFLYNGTQPTSNQTIPLHPGWNMVGYPSLKSYNRTNGLNNLTFYDQVDAIWSYDAGTQKWEEMGESDYFQISRGYYIHAKSECEWEVPL